MIGARMASGSHPIFPHASVNPTSKCQTQPTSRSCLRYSSLSTFAMAMLPIYIHHSSRNFKTRKQAQLRMRAIRHLHHSLINWRASSAFATHRQRGTNNGAEAPLSFVPIRNIMSESEQAPAFDTPRLVLKKILAKSQQEGDGAVVKRGIGRSELKSLDPFLMLDHFSVSPPAGFPDHPHRGFETVTYMLEGGITHQDFAGHKGTIRTGDVQWMTAGRGIIHSEMPAGEGTHKGVQLWINLSARDKMIEPNYQELLKEDIPVADQDGAEVRVIAGEAMGVHSPVYTRTPTLFLDFTLNPGAQLHQCIPESWNCFVYVIEGEGVFGSLSSSPVIAHHVLVLSLGDGVSVWNNSSKPLRFLLIGGQPLNEPVAQYGPFVMNTQSQIERTIEDYQYCRNGFEMGKYWRSQ